MVVNKWIKAATNQLKAAGVGSARLDALILLEDQLGKDRDWLLAHPESPLTGTTLKKLGRQVERRAKHEPLAYIRGFSEFYGRKFRVNKRVLEPRPESETMIDLLKEVVESGKWKAESKGRIADVGTGSGALGITAALELHNPQVDLFDIDAGALGVAKHNCELHELRLKVAKRDLLHSCHTHYDVILANLPYVPTHFKINEAAAREPRIAIFGGADGLDVYRRLFEQLNGFFWRPGYIFTEALPPQHPKLTQIAKDSGFKLKTSQDFIQVFEPA